MPKKNMDLGQYELECILDIKRDTDGIEVFLVKYKNWSHNYDRWLAISQIGDGEKDENVVLIRRILAGTHAGPLPQWRLDYLERKEKAKEKNDKKKEKLRALNQPRPSSRPSRTPAQSSIGQSSTSKDRAARSSSRAAGQANTSQPRSRYGRSASKTKHTPQSTRAQRAASSSIAVVPRSRRHSAVSTTSTSRAAGQPTPSSSQSMPRGRAARSSSRAAGRSNRSSSRAPAKQTDEWEIEHILDMKVENGKELFLIHWKNWSHVSDVWRGIEYITHGDDDDHVKMIRRIIAGEVDPLPQWRLDYLDWKSRREEQREVEKRREQARQQRYLQTASRSSNRPSRTAQPASSSHRGGQPSVSIATARSQPASKGKAGPSTRSANSSSNQPVDLPESTKATERRSRRGDAEASSSSLVSIPKKRRVSNAAHDTASSTNVVSDRTRSAGGIVEGEGGETSSSALVSIPRKRRSGADAQGSSSKVVARSPARRDAALAAEGGRDGPSTSGEDQASSSKVVPTTRSRTRSAGAPVEGGGATSRTRSLSTRSARHNDSSTFATPMMSVQDPVVPVGEEVVEDSMPRRRRTDSDSTDPMVNGEPLRGDPDEIAMDTHDAMDDAPSSSSSSSGPAAMIPDGHFLAIETSPRISSRIIPTVPSTASADASGCLPKNSIPSSIGNADISDMNDVPSTSGVAISSVSPVKPGARERAEPSTSATSTLTRMIGRPPTASLNRQRVYESDEDDEDEDKNMYDNEEIEEAPVALAVVPRQDPLDAQNDDAAVEEEETEPYILPSLACSEYPAFNWMAHLGEKGGTPAPEKCFWKRPVGQFTNPFCNYIGKVLVAPLTNDNISGVYSTAAVAVIKDINGPWIEVSLVDGDKSKKTRWMANDFVLQELSRDFDKQDSPRIVNPRHPRSASPYKFAKYFKAGTEQVVPAGCFRNNLKSEDKPTANHFQVGMKLETYGSTTSDGNFWPATIVAVNDDTVTVRIDGLSAALDKVLHFADGRLYPCGYASAIGWKCRMPSIEESGGTMRGKKRGRPFKSPETKKRRIDSEDSDDDWSPLASRQTKKKPRPSTGQQRLSFEQRRQQKQEREERERQLTLAHQEHRQHLAEQWQQQRQELRQQLHFGPFQSGLSGQAIALKYRDPELDKHCKIKTQYPEGFPAVGSEILNWESSSTSTASTSVGTTQGPSSSTAGAYTNGIH